MSITSKSLLSGLDIGPHFRGCVDIDSDLRISLEEPRRKVIALDTDLHEPLLGCVLERLYNLKNYFGWKVLLHHTLRDSEYAHYLGLTDFYDFHSLDPQDSFTHLVIADSHKAHRPYPLFAPEHSVFVYNSAHCPEALDTLDVIINHGWVLGPHDPRLQRISEEKLVKAL